MKKLLILAAWTFSFKIGIAQIQFDNDTFYKSSFFDKEFDSVFSISKTNDFEFRLTIVPPIIIPGRQITIFLMTQKDNQWSAELLKRVNYKYSQVDLDSSGLSTLWQGLLYQKITTIPDNSKLKDKNGQIAMSNMKDGTSYHFSLISKTAKRSFWYYSPQSAIDEYPKIDFFKHVSRIIELIRHYCSF